MLTTTLFSMLVQSPAHAEDAEEFLLADLGVRIDLPAGPWRMTRWSDWDFKAEYASPTGTILLVAWATPVQIPIGDDASGWSDTYLAKVEEMGGTAATIRETSVRDVAGRAVAQVDGTFTFGEGGPAGVVLGSTLEIAGQNMHLAVVSSARSERIAEGQRTALIDTLDVRTEPPRGKFGATVEASGISFALPKGWRVPTEAEVTEVVVPVLGQLGLADLEGCTTGIRPFPGGPADVLITCQGGLLLGVVDEYSFEAVDAVVRDKVFGGVEVTPAERIDLADRVGFAYQPTDGLAVGIVPYDLGVARTWVLGEGDVKSDLMAAMESASLSGPHPASLGDQVSYWLVHRPTSPPVLAGGGVLALLGLGIGALGLRRLNRDPYADFDDEE